VVVAGPNGAGKSTFVDTFLRPTGILIVNPDKDLDLQDRSD
jgi:predicted ABC-type ATPase